VGATAALLIAAVAAVGAAAGWFTTRYLDDVAVEAGVREILTEHYDLADVGRVDCPPDEEISPGNTFTCTVQLDGPKTVRVTVRDERGTYIVGLPS
jgi:hypothetical protein